MQGMRILFWYEWVVNKIPQKYCVQSVELKLEKHFNQPMDANSLLIGRFKMQCNQFSGIISKGLSKPKQNLVKQMIYGIQASKDVKLSNISRSLQEPIPLIKTEDRLSRNLDDEDLSEHINGHLLRLGDDKIHKDMVIAIDPGDIMKPYAKAMEHLCNIYDGSEKEPAKGYHLCQVTAANLDHNKVVPLYCEAYSSIEENFAGKTEKIKAIISRVKKSIGTNGTWAIDREGDNNELIEHFMTEELTFVTRLKLSRFVHLNGNTAAQVQSDHLTRHVSLNHKARITKIEDGKETVINVTYGVATAALPHQPDKEFTLVMIAGFGQHPMILLTNKQVNTKDPKAVWQIIEIYLTRWKCDECYRYIKQSYNLEDLRVRSYISIRNIAVMVHAIAYFASVYLGLSMKLKIMVQKIFILSKRFFGVPTFYHYAMADGIFELLKKARQGIDLIGKTGITHDQCQLDLFPD